MTDTMNETTQDTSANPEWERTADTLTKDALADYIGDGVSNLKSEIDDDTGAADCEFVIRATDMDKVVEDINDMIYEWNQNNELYLLHLYSIRDVYGIPDAKRITLQLAKVIGEDDAWENYFHFDTKQAFCQILDPNSLPKPPRVKKVLTDEQRERMRLARIKANEERKKLKE